MMLHDVAEALPLLIRRFTMQEIRENSKLIAADVASNVKDLEKDGLTNLTTSYTCIMCIYIYML